MTKRLTHTLTYDAPLAEVSAMLATAAFREEVCAHQRVASATVVIEGGTVVVHQVQDTAGMASFAQKFVGDDITIVQRERWSTEDRADVEVEIPGKPCDIGGTIVLSEAGGVTTETVELDIKVSIPLVGGKIEGVISDLLGKALEAEHTVGRRWLAR